MFKKSAVLVAIAFVCVATVRSSLFGSASAATPTPIKHVVVLFLENHSFDDLLGRFCVQTSRCDGVDTGQLHTGKSIPLSVEPDIVPIANHSPYVQRQCMNNGLMNGCDQTRGCNKLHEYRCYTAVQPGAVPNITSMARDFAISDRTFELTVSSSWGGHTELVAATNDGFLGVNPKKGTAGGRVGPGWGCDSKKDAPSAPTPSDPSQMVPSCVPDQAGNGPYKTSPVAHVPTVWDRLDSAGLNWTLYAAGAHDGPRAGYARSICPTFYECLDTQQSHLKSPTTFVTDASAGNLPTFSIVVPAGTESMHPGYSLTAGDNWIADQVNAVEQGQDWDSTAVFITWDDCGCFYDHVNPLQYDPNWGMRVPMIIVSPWAKPGYTDSTPATFASIVAFTEHVFQLNPLGAADNTAYDYMDSFNFTGPPRPAVHLRSRPVPPASLRHIAEHPPAIQPS